MYGELQTWSILLWPRRKDFSGAPGCLPGSRRIATRALSSDQILSDQACTQLHYPIPGPIVPGMAHLHHYPAST